MHPKRDRGSHYLAQLGVEGDYISRYVQGHRAYSHIVAQHKVRAQPDIVTYFANDSRFLAQSSHWLHWLDCRAYSASN